MVVGRMAAVGMRSGSEECSNAGSDGSAMVGGKVAAVEGVGKHPWSAEGRLAVEVVGSVAGGVGRDERGGTRRRAVEAWERCWSRYSILVLPWFGVSTVEGIARTKRLHRQRFLVFVPYTAELFYVSTFFASDSR